MDPSPPPQIDGFAPTTVNRLISCPYRVALERAGRVKRLPNPFAALGQVAHAMNELYWKGAFAGLIGGELETELQSAWDSQIATREEDLAKAYGIGIPPRAIDWPGYALTRSRTLRTLRRLAAERGAELSSVRMQPEIKLVDPGTGLYGTLDRLEESEDRLTVVDLKSGAWQEDIRPEQRRQLLLYAWLVWVNRQRWPSEITIETAAGRQTSIAVDPAEVTECVAEAQAAVRQYNIDVADGWNAIEAAARPSDDTCRGCPARLRCEPYWAALRSEWRFHGAARGVVSTSEASGDGTTVSIVTESPADRAGQTTVAYQVRSLDPHPGDVFAIVGADERGAAGMLRGRWDTQAAVVWSAGT